MIFRSRYCLSALALAVATIVAGQAFAEHPGLQGTNQYSAGVVQAGGFGPQAAPPLPASPLAGGMPATGGAYMDVHGRPVVLPASYCQSCPPAYGGGAMGAGYGDPMAVDFGGYAQEQCGPHYFDVSVGVLFLQGEDFFEGVGPFTAPNGIGTPERVNDPQAGFGEYEPGWEIALRYDIGPLAVLEAAYFGSYDISFSESAQSDFLTDPNVSPLFSVFSNFGVSPIAGIEDGIMQSVDYNADLQSTQINYRRYWVGNSSSVSGTYVLGARYWRFTDDFSFSSQAVDAPTLATALLQWSGENDLVGFHFGGDAWACLRQGLRIGLEGTAGVYNNRFKISNSGTFNTATLTPPDDYANDLDGNQVAFATEAKASFVADILPSWSLRGGYRVLYLSSLATAENNIQQTIPEASAPSFSTQRGLLFHGFEGGLEYIW